MQNLKKHKTEKDTICEHTCANCSCPSVLFSAFFIFVLFATSKFWEMFLIGSQKSKITKYQSNKTKNNKKTRCKAKIQTWWFKTKRDNKQKNKNKITSWTKKQAKQKQKARTRIINEKDEGRKKITIEIDREWKKERERGKRGRPSGEIPNFKPQIAFAGDWARIWLTWHCRALNRKGAQQCQTSVVCPVRAPYPSAQHPFWGCWHYSSWRCFTLNDALFCGAQTTNAINWRTTLQTLPTTLRKPSHPFGFMFWLFPFSAL